MGRTLSSWVSFCVLGAVVQLQGADCKAFHAFGRPQGKGADLIDAHPAGSNIKFFMYPSVFKEQQIESYWMSNLTAAMTKNSQLTKDPKEAEVFFMGMDFCCEIDWPNYSNDPPEANYRFGFPDKCWKSRDDRLKAYIKNDATYLAAPASFGGREVATTEYMGKGTHVIIDMRGWTVVDRELTSNAQQIIYAAPSWDMTTYRRGIDVSWPAMAITSFDEPGRKLQCKTPAKHKVVFKGTNDWGTRKSLESIHNGEDVIVHLTDFKANCGPDDYGKNYCGTGMYKDLMTSTDFGLVIRGDNMYSYRFLEVLSAGAIPVVFADKWVLPFFEVIDYKAFAIVLGEHDWEKALPTIRAVPQHRVCEMRTEALRVWREHFSTFEAQFKTFLMVLEARKAGKDLKPPVDWHELCRDGNTEYTCDN
jgi:hypothetical protein